MRILICDDDLSITQSLSQIIKTYFNKKKVNNLDIITFNDGDSLLSDKSQKGVGDGLLEGDTVIVTGNLNLAHEAEVYVK